MINTKLLIFDMDGTLFRTETVDVRAINESLIKCGFASKTEEEILQVIGLKLKDVFKTLSFCNDETLFYQFAKDLVHLEQLYIVKYGQLYDEVIQTNRFDEWGVD